MTDVPSERRVAVVGGGPAGLIAAEELARSHVPVTVYDHSRSVGRKFLLAGRSGLNLTNGEPLDQLLARYGPAADRLADAIRAFDPVELRAWCDGLGETPFVGSSGRVFPSSWRATPLLRAWRRRLDDLGVEFRTRCSWDGFIGTSGSRFRAEDDTVFEVHPSATIMALGGATWSRTGSDGAWVTGFEAAGVTIAPLRPANAAVGVTWSAAFADRFQGVPLKNVGLSVGGESARGDPVVTLGGLEGGPVYALTAHVRHEVDRTGAVVMQVDLHPDLSVDQVLLRLSRRRPKESTSTWLRRSLGLHAVGVGLLRECTGNHLPVDVAELADLVKAVPVRVTGTAAIARAISTAGGVSFDDLDGRFMLRARPGTFVAGEMLDWEAPTGGYLLQASFSTGVASARGAMAWLVESSAIG
ncbi:MAG: TIGR03862 family flavoprotein [Ilumatobacteraceae bacterium]